MGNTGLVVRGASNPGNDRRGLPPSGFTIIELVVAATILVILTGLILPTARLAVRREKERQLKATLRDMRDAIDRYKDAADRGAFNKADTNGYPTDLETLVKGVDVNGKKVGF